MPLHWEKKGGFMSHHWLKCQTSQNQNIWNMLDFYDWNLDGQIWKGSSILTPKCNLGMSTLVDLALSPVGYRMKNLLVCSWLNRRTAVSPETKQIPLPLPGGNFLSADITNYFLSHAGSVSDISIVLRAFPLSFTFSLGFLFSVKHCLKVVFKYVCSLHLYFSLPSHPLFLT